MNTTKDALTRIRIEYLEKIFGGKLIAKNADGVPVSFDELATNEFFRDNEHRMHVSIHGKYSAEFSWNVGVQKLPPQFGDITIFGECTSVVVHGPHQELLFEQRDRILSGGEKEQLVPEKARKSFWGRLHSEFLQPEPLCDFGDAYPPYLPPVLVAMKHLADQGMKTRLHILSDTLSEHMRYYRDTGLVDEFERCAQSSTTQAHTEELCDQAKTLLAWELEEIRQEVHLRQFWLDRTVPLERKIERCHSWIGHQLVPGEATRPRMNIMLSGEHFGIPAWIEFLSKKGFGGSFIVGTLRDDITKDILKTSQVDVIFHKVPPNGRAGDFANSYMFSDMSQNVIDACQTGTTPYAIYCLNEERGITILKHVGNPLNIIKW